MHDLLYQTVIAKATKLKFIMSTSINLQFDKWNLKTSSGLTGLEISTFGEKNWGERDEAVGSRHGPLDEL